MTSHKKHKKYKQKKQDKRNIIKSCVIAIPIGTLYYIFINRACLSITEHVTTQDKLNKIILLSLFSGIFGLIMAFKIFGNNKSKLYNRSLKYGLIFGSILVLIDNIMYNWNNVSNTIKMLFIGFILLFISIMTYKIK